MAEHDLIRTASAVWNGDGQQGAGRMKLGGGAFEGAYSFKTRMGNEPGTNPEELLGAAHAGCFSMALAFGLSGAGHPPTSIATTAKVHFGRTDAGFAIGSIELETEGVVPGIDAAGFQSAAEAAKAGCPVSKALAAVPITLRATLKSG
jgi:lipoyl-dependent peroxiredoxin